MAIAKKTKKKKALKMTKKIDGEDEEDGDDKEDIDEEEIDGDEAQAIGCSEESTIIFDNLYLDMNDIIHGSCFSPKNRMVIDTHLNPWQSPCRMHR